MATKISKKSSLIAKAIETNEMITLVLKEANNYSKKDMEDVVSSLEYVKYLVETYILVKFD